jgi:hypothetical protein
MTIRRAAAVVAIALGAWPSAAAAEQGHVDPPGGDAYTKPVSISSFDMPAPLPTDVEFDADTSTYTLQNDMYDPPASGGPREPRRCGDSTYSKTIWTVFHADRKGVMTIQAAGDFDAVIAFVPFGNPNDDAAPHLDEGVCIDASSTHTEKLRVEVGADHWYAVQVGGTGKPAGGHVALHFHFAPAGEQATKTLQMALKLVRPRAVSRGVIVRKLIVARRKKNGEPVGPSPRGATVAIRCVRGCRSRTLKLKGNAIRVGYLENKVLRPGTKFVVRVTRRDPLARGPQWTVTVDRNRKIHVSRARLVGG